MSSTVFANQNGLFHKGSDGKGMAFPDVCLTPPPPPAGPVPIPYPNKVSAADLAEGSTTVKVQGEPTALKDQSYVSTSTGDESGTQGGGVVTHKTKGKGYFKFWSMDVFIEGMNADCHADPMGQNAGSNAVNGLCMRSSVVREAYNLAQSSDCGEAYANRDHHVDPNAEQDRQAAAEHAANGGRCWECKKKCTDYHVDHFPPVVLLWYSGGCKQTEDDWKDSCRSVRARPHCAVCSRAQSTEMARINRELITKLGL